MERERGFHSRVDTAIILTIVGDLGPTTPNDLTTGGNETEFADIDLDDGTLGEDAQLGIHRILRVLLHRKDGELNGHAEFGVGDVGLFVPKSHGSDEAFVLDGPSGEIRSDYTYHVVFHLSVEAGR